MYSISIPRPTSTQLYTPNNLPLEEHPVVSPLDLSNNNASYLGVASIPLTLSSINDVDNTLVVVEQPSGTSDVVDLPRRKQTFRVAPRLYCWLS